MDHHQVVCRVTEWEIRICKRHIYTIVI